MKTEELVAMLARQAGPAPQGIVAGQVAAAGAVGLLLSAGAAIATPAAHLVDHVIPHVPMRQWVLSLPSRCACCWPHDRSR
jgi:hypothetical protein